MLEFDQMLIMTRSRLGLLPVNFHKFVTELWPLIDVRFSFPPNILTTYGYSFTKFCLTRSRLGLLPVIYHKCVTELWPLVDVRISFLLKTAFLFKLECISDLKCSKILCQKNS